MTGYVKKGSLQVFLVLASIAHKSLGILSDAGSRGRIWVIFAGEWRSKIKSGTLRMRWASRNSLEGPKPLSANLFDFDFGAGCFDLLLDVFSLLLGNTFLDRFGRAFHERFGFS